MCLHRLVPRLRLHVHWMRPFRRTVRQLKCWSLVPIKSSIELNPRSFPSSYQIDALFLDERLICMKGLLGKRLSGAVTRRSSSGGGGGLGSAQADQAVAYDRAASKLSKGLEKSLARLED